MKEMALASATEIVRQPQKMQRAFGVGRLAVSVLEQRTRLVELYQEGCAKIRLPRTREKAMEAVLINTSGGVTGGDNLSWQVRAHTGTHLTLTSQACEKIYRSSEGAAQISSRIDVGAGARVDWLPQETILFDRAALNRRLEVHLAADASFLAVEATILGRAGMGERVGRAHFHDRWRIFRDNNLIHAEETKLSGDIAELCVQRAVLGGNSAFATLFFTGPACRSLAETVKSALLGCTEGASVWDDKLVVRLMAADGYTLRKRLIKLIEIMRDQPIPRIWNS